MASSGTYTFALDIADIIEEAYEQAGLELRSSYDLTTARRSLDLLLTEWANQQVNLWKVEQKTVALVASTTTYTIADPVIDILDGVIRDANNLDVPCERLSFQEYLDRTDKAQEGRPSQFSVLRGPASLSVSFWNTPDIAYTFVYYALQYVEDIGSVYTNNPNIPRRFLPALTTGLAWKLAQKNPAKLEIDPSTGRSQQVGGVDMNKLNMLKTDYLESFSMARDEDRERASFFVRPSIRY